jgi:hypothetical protein
VYLSLTNDLINNPLKMVPAVSAEAIIVLSSGRRNVKDVTNTITDAKTMVGIQYATALEGLSAPDLIPVTISFMTNPAL